MITDRGKECSEWELLVPNPCILQRAYLQLEHKKRIIPVLGVCKHQKSCVLLSIMRLNKDICSAWFMYKTFKSDSIWKATLPTSLSGALPIFFFACFTFSIFIYTLQHSIATFPVGFSDIIKSTLVSSQPTGVSTPDPLICEHVIGRSLQSPAQHSPLLKSFIIELKCFSWPILIR